MLLQAIQKNKAESFNDKLIIAQGKLLFQEQQQVIQFSQQIRHIQAYKGFLTVTLENEVCVFDEAFKQIITVPFKSRLSLYNGTQLLLASFKLSLFDSTSNEIVPLTNDFATSLAASSDTFYAGSAGNLIQIPFSAPSPKRISLTSQLIQQLIFKNDNLYAITNNYLFINGKQQPMKLKTATSLAVDDKYIYTSGGDNILSIFQENQRIFALGQQYELGKGVEQLLIVRNQQIIVSLEGSFSSLLVLENQIWSRKQVFLPGNAISQLAKVNDLLLIFNQFQGFVYKNSLHSQCIRAGCEISSVLPLDNSFLLCSDEASIRCYQRPEWISDTENTLTDLPYYTGKSTPLSLTVQPISKSNSKIPHISDSFQDFNYGNDTLWPEKSEGAALSGARCLGAVFSNEKVFAVCDPGRQDENSIEIYDLNFRLQKGVQPVKGSRFERICAGFSVFSITKNGLLYEIFEASEAVFLAEIAGSLGLLACGDGSVFVLVENGVCVVKNGKLEVIESQKFDFVCFCNEKLFLGDSNGGIFVLENGVIVKQDWCMSGSVTQLICFGGQMVCGDKFGLVRFIPIE